MNRRTPLVVLGSILFLAVATVGAFTVAATAAAVEGPIDPLTKNETDVQENETNARNSLSAHATVRGGPSTGEDIGGGDVDGDGSADVLVGQPFNDEAGENGGAAHLFYGPVEGGEYDIEDADLTIRGSAGGQWTGYDVNVDDVDGDGYGDLIVSAPLREEGYVYVFYGGPSLSGTLTPDDADVVLSGVDQDEQLGLAVDPVERESGAGLVIGAPRSDVGGENAGAAYYFESPSTDVTTADADLRLVGAESGHTAGWDVAGADADGNGSAEIAVGARGVDDAAGAAYVVSSNWSGTHSLADADIVVRGAQSGDRAGQSVDIVGTDDGGEVVVGAPSANRDGSNSGAVYVSPVESTDLSERDPVFVGSSGDRAGWDVTAGDVTCDDRPDLLVGAPYAEDKAGAAYVVPGGGGDAAQLLTGESAGDFAGYRLALVANATGGETRDALVGAPHENTTNVTGHAYLLEGECAVDTSPVENATTGDGNGTDSARNGTDGTENGSANGTETGGDGGSAETDDATTGPATADGTNGLPVDIVPASVAVAAALATVGVVVLWRRRL